MRSAIPRPALVQRRTPFFIGLVVLSFLLVAGATLRSRPAHTGASMTAQPATVAMSAPATAIATIDPYPRATVPASPPLIVAPLSAQASREPEQPAASYFAGHRIVSYYGHPWARGMGIVGEHEPEELLRRLRAQADRYRPLDPAREVVPAIHLIFAVAQADAGSNGLYLGRMPDELVRWWIDFTRDHGLLLFLDIQFGRSTVDREMAAILPYLEEAHVHLALDPEFKWGPRQFPHQHIGALDGAEINRTQELLQAFMVERGLGHKILIVHQFLRSMITNKDTITMFDGIDLVIDADGFGPPGTKIGSYNAVVRDDGIGYPGFKLFYRQDAASERLMREDEVLGLEPSPVLVIYQ